MAFVTRLRPHNPIKPGGYIYVAIMFALHPTAEIPVKTNVFPSLNAISLFLFYLFFSNVAVTENMHIIYVHCIEHTTVPPMNAWYIEVSSVEMMVVYWCRM